MGRVSDQSVLPRYPACAKCACDPSENWGRNESPSGQIRGCDANRFEFMSVQRTSLAAGKGVWIARHDSAAGLAIIRRLWGEKCSLILATNGQFEPNRRRSLDRWMEKQRPQAVIVADGLLPSGDDATDPYDAELLFLCDLLAAAGELGVERLVQVVPARPQPHPPSRRSGAWSRRRRHPGGAAAAPFAHVAALSAGNTDRRNCSVLTLEAPVVYAPDWSADWGPTPFLTQLVGGLGLAVLQGARNFTIMADNRLLPPMMHADDLADAAVFAADHCDGIALLRCGRMEHLKADELVRIVAEIVGFHGSIEIRFGRGGQQAAVGSNARSIESLGWRPQVSLRDGIVDLYHAWFTRQAAAMSGAFLHQ